MSGRPLREARVDLGAIARNIEVLRREIQTPTMIVVKADAYGHGAIEVARTAVEAGAEWLGVADLDEALALRAAGIATAVLAWIHDHEAEFAPAIAAGVDIGVNSLAQLERVGAAVGRASVHLKVDTGLSRNGSIESEWAAFFGRAASLVAEGAITVRGIFSHLANAGDDADLAQVARFEAALAQARAAGLDPEFIHLAATAGALVHPSARFTLVRIGIGAYGLSPLAGGAGEFGLTPAMELSAGIVSVKRVPAGSGVSYGFTYRADAETTLALVPLGYADGVPRHASGAGPVWINGSTYRVAGRIAMDQFVVDVGDAAVAPGDRAVLFGDPATGAPSAQQWADAADTINYEIVTRIGPRVTRVYER